MDIVVGALSGLVEALPEKLGELVAQEYELLAGARGDVLFLQRELGSMRAAIQHCESLDHPDAQTGAWVGRVRELALDIQDWVDFFAIRVDAGAGDEAPSSSRFSAWMRRMANKVTTMPARHTIANELRELKERVVELSAQRDRYRYAAPVPAASRPLDPRLAALYADPGGLVGLDAPVEEVSKLVTDAADNGELKIVSITGMAGSGKTTLAKAVFDQLKKQNCFDCHAFVTVGRNPDIAGKTLKDMLSQLRDRHRGGDDIHQLIGRVRETLEKKRYLVVLDDVWSRGNWEAIRYSLPENKLGSRIITTTRNDTLLMDYSSGLSKIVHKISHLGDDDAKNLFLKKAFGNGHGFPHHLEDVLAQVMRRCEGLPLAVVTVAGMLAQKQPSRDEWERLGMRLVWISDSDAVKQILNLSYHDLSTHLRACLLYLSIFPENYEIDIDRLLRRWIAEGFISEAHSVSAEEAARSCLNELISKNLVQPLHLNHDGIPKSCRVHPVIHDFIVCKSMEENFATLMDAQHQHVPAINGTIRRLALKNSNKQDQPAVRNESWDLSHARSVTVFGNASGAPRLTDLSVVRVLDLEDCSGPVCLDGICKLLLLRYLSLKGTDVSVLPAEIGELRCLETLDVRSTKVKEIPPSIVKLKRLMHLLAGAAKLPDGIAKMKALKTLSCSANAMERLSQLANLRELELVCDAAEVLGGEKQVTFPGDGFQGVKQLRIRCSSTSVTFEPGSLSMVQFLELKFEKGLPDKSSGVSGIEHLSNLKHVLVEFVQQDAGAMSTIIDAVRKAADTFRPSRLEVTVKVDGKSH
ncbi:hypothetical protein ACP70R_029960 [Stipagrostis hirtigluma subsp. patula]